MKTFIKPIDNSTGKLLYIMGSTWHNQCMFDLELNEPNFSSLLNIAGFETYTFDIAGVSIVEPIEHVGDKHKENIDYCVKLINDYNIDYIIGYSYGALVASDILEQFPNLVKKIVLLDPYPGVAQDPVYVDNGDKKIVSIDTVQTDLIKFGSTVTEYVKKQYLEKFANGKQHLIVAAYPGKVLKNNFEKFTSNENIARLNQPTVKVFFTKNSKPLVRNKFKNAVLYNHSSHWILIEPGRTDLVKDIVNFFNS